ncbi:resolvase [Enterococcus moraviensis ATCC BAA-383]|uniref:Resolvase n=1 Tax=Enterococcus moraviensis ATCC BAA-383 TaxID=1158609 RepID=R2SUR9_9ENTE|nr:recombinase family protein [Enterococcus moraviensis]EOH96556.1 resolvase [Enterococcus moraviensis ATCC BAA-383]EOT65982.1 resolvase [Enterococcus moraviensis ATCC BAA-383]OJG68246.1 resolvase [Enterococcus moraviensis]
MKIIGYARTTITDNDLDAQIKVLSDYGCDEIYHEAFDVTNDKHLISELETVLGSLAAGDTLVICRLNRLGRSTRQLTELTQTFKGSGIHLVSLDEEIDTRHPVGEIYFKLMNELAKMECDLIKERTLVGLNNARKKGKIGGRPKIDGRTVKKIRHLYHEKKETIQFISSKCNVSVGTCYKYINLSEEEVLAISQDNKN